MWAMRCVKHTAPKHLKLDFFVVVQGYPVLTASERVFFPHAILTVGLRMQHHRQKVDATLQKQTNPTHTTNLRPWFIETFPCHWSLVLFKHVFSILAELRPVCNSSKMLGSRNEACYATCNWDSKTWPSKSAAWSAPSCSCQPPQSH